LFISQPRIHHRDDVLQILPTVLRVSEQLHFFLQNVLMNRTGSGNLPPIPGASGTFPPIPGARNRDEEMEMNPFKLPADDQIFRMREEEKRKKLEEKKNNQQLKIWEKKKDVTTSNAARMEELVGETHVKGFTDLMRSSGRNNTTGGTQQLQQTNPGTSLSTRRQEKENMSEFIAKKREMFLVQMSLDTKREEIRKLEEKAQMKEEALQRSEQMLEEDAMRFDAFLKENDKKAHDAIKRAEEETKKKQEKTQEIKRLTQQIQALTSEMSKHKEALEDCLRYKTFLDMLTPPEWFEQHKRLIQQRKYDLKHNNWEKKYLQWEAMKKRLVDQHKKELLSENAKKENSKNKKNKKVIQQQHDEGGEGGDGANVTSGGGGDSPRLNIPPPPRLEDEPEVEIEDEEAPMYFTHPQQLMDIFAALEEQNLFLIQNSQETEHTLEELNLASKETAKMMQSQTDALKQQIQELKNEIFVEEKRAKDLLIKKNAAAAGVSTNAGGGGNNNTLASTQVAAAALASHNQSQYEKEKLLSDLHVKVRYVYEQCGFDASSKPSTLFMLSQLESRLELLLSDIDKMPQDYVIKAEKEKEKKRRERKREEQQSMQEKLQEERNKRAIERSLQAPKKRTGRQVMFRSKPIRKERVNHGDENNSGDNNDEMRFLT
jgi:hypothetical protein